MTAPAAGSSVDLLRDALAANRGGRPVGLTSVCSANPVVLETALLRAADADGIVCLESTASQVNQEGGYAGMTPAAFVAAVAARAAAAGVKRERVVVGGDHLGPYPWRSRPAGEAMARACELVRGCTLAGYAKLHLDASPRCTGDPEGATGGLDEELVVERTVALCRAAEAARAELPAAAPAPVYVIGSEVPAPGGETAGAARPAVTAAAAAEHTLALTRDGFAESGLDDAWSRVLALVVQPGIEFGDAHVIDYDRAAAAELSACVARLPGVVFEAHSTDYQAPAALQELVADHFAILKVGPWLTFAFREAVFALEAIARELTGDAADTAPHGVRGALEAAMLERPEQWRAYYRGDAAELRLARAFSYSDRCRYYWPEPRVRDALAALLRGLTQRPLPETLLSQYLPAEYDAVRSGELRPEPAALIRHHIGRVLKVYAAACGA